ncbi:gfo/Idh/MocA family oxidoreductase, partial [Mycobacterium tuberculosis]|nr:gfo/Idh/MocA family oxidoreductase [Mycobacterium tuberculosis]
AHAVATALRIAGARRREDVESIELERFRANEIEADDTSSPRVALRDGRRVTAALTLASPEQAAPLIEVHTREADVLFAYTSDELTYP